MEDITDKDYMHAKAVRKELGERFISLKRYRTFSSCFENFRKMCLNIYNLDPAKFLSSPGLS